MRAFPDAAARGIRAGAPITRLLSHSDQSAPRALRHGIQLGLLRPIVDSRSAGIAEFPSSQHPVAKVPRLRKSNPHQSICLDAGSYRRVPPVAWAGFVLSRVLFSTYRARRGGGRGAAGLEDGGVRGGRRSSAREASGPDRRRAVSSREVRGTTRCRGRCRTTAPRGVCCRRRSRTRRA
jgi:hypothetical protein